MKEREVEDWDQGRGRSMRRSTPDMGAAFMLVLALMAPCDTGAKGSLQHHTSAAALSALLRPTLRSGLSCQHTSSGGATRMMGFVPSQGQLLGPWGSVRLLVPCNVVCASCVFHPHLMCQACAGMRRVRTSCVSLPSAKTQKPKAPTMIQRHLQPTT